MLSAPICLRWRRQRLKVSGATSSARPRHFCERIWRSCARTRRRFSRSVPEYEPDYARRGWKMFAGIDRVYVNDSARTGLGWRPRYDFRYVLERLMRGDDFRSELAQKVGSKGYHSLKFAGVPYPAE